jgi:hypothetical protein
MPMFRVLWRVSPVARRMLFAVIAAEASPVLGQQPPVQIVRIVGSSIAANADDLRHPATVVSATMHGDVVYVAASRPSGVVVMDLRTLRITGTIGLGSGSGPGELRRPARVLTIGDRVAVADVVNSRVSIFSTDGAVVRSTPLLHPNAANSVVLLSDGMLVTAGGAPASHLLLRSDSAYATPTRPFGLVPRRAAPDPAAGTNLVVGTSRRGEVLVVDNDIGALLAVSPRGEVRTVWSAPTAYRDSVRRERELIRRRNPQAVVPVPIVRDASIQGDRVVLLGHSLSTARPVLSGWVVEVATGRYSELRSAPSLDVPGRLLGLSISGERALIVTEHELFLAEVRQ